MLYSSGSYNKSKCRRRSSRIYVEYIRYIESSQFRERRRYTKRPSTPCSETGRMRTLVANCVADDSTGRVVRGTNIPPLARGVYFCTLYCQNVLYTYTFQQLHFIFDFVFVKGCRVLALLHRPKAKYIVH